MHRLCFRHTGLLTTFSVNREISDGEQFKPDFGIRFRVVDKLEWRGEFLAETAWDLIQHKCSMLNGEEPILMADLFLSNIGPGHTDDSLPGTFN